MAVHLFLRNWGEVELKVCTDRHQFKGISNHVKSTKMTASWGIHLSNLDFITFNQLSIKSQGCDTLQHLNPILYIRKPLENMAQYSRRQMFEMTWSDKVQAFISRISTIHLEGSINNDRNICSWMQLSLESSRQSWQNIKRTLQRMIRQHWWSINCECVAAQPKIGHQKLQRQHEHDEQLTREATL